MVNHKDESCKTISVFCTFLCFVLTVVFGSFIIEINQFNLRINNNGFDIYDCNVTNFYNTNYTNKNSSYIYMTGYIDSLNLTNTITIQDKNYTFLLKNTNYILLENQVNKYRKSYLDKVVECFSDGNNIYLDYDYTFIEEITEILIVLISTSSLCFFIFCCIFCKKSKCCC